MMESAHDLVKWQPDEIARVEQSYRFVVATRKQQVSRELFPTAKMVGFPVNFK